MSSKPPSPPPAPTTPTRASFVSRGTTGNTFRPTQRVIRPITGGSKTNVGRPTLLGGF